MCIDFDGDNKFEIHSCVIIFKNIDIICIRFSYLVSPLENNIFQVHGKAFHAPA